MNPIQWIKQLFYKWGSHLAVVLVRRRLRKRPYEPEVWLLLARLHEVRKEITEAKRVLVDSLKLFPKNRLLRNHLERLESKDE